MTNMKRYFISAIAALSAAAALIVTGCVREELPDNRDKDYGYVQFKLYKAASYGTKASSTGYDMDSLSQASKITVVLNNSEGRTISQTLTLSAADNAAAEFGLRSAKLRLLKGEYEVATYALYDQLDKPLGGTVTVTSPLTVTAGGLEIFDLTANVMPRGMIRFHLVKKMDFEQDKDNPQLDNPELTRSGAVINRSYDNRDRQYTFDEIKTANITIVNMDDPLAAPVTFSGLPVEFSVKFRDDETFTGQIDKDDPEFGYRISSSVADTVVYAPAGNYKISRYEIFDEDEVLLESEDLATDDDSQEAFTVEDNVLKDADVHVTLYEDDEYIQDNYALYLLWKALNGPNWSYEGQSYAKGTNWNFNKDVDLWCDQPGVQIHPNGRIASIDLSGFGIKGDVPAAIGQFTELVQLSFGNHNETNQYHTDNGTAAAAFPVNGTAEEKAAWRKRAFREFANAVHPAEQMSPACALALRQHGLTSSAASYYEDMATDDIARMAAGVSSPSDFQIRPYDMNHGKRTNGLTSIHENIKYLTRLESLSIANSPIKTEGFPSEEAFAQLTSLTELEIYNCDQLEGLPKGISRLPNLISMNLSNNGFSPANAKQALIDVATGASEDVLQILYFLQNNLEEVPVELGGMGSLGMINLSMNNIKGTLPAFGDDFKPESVLLDDNAIESVPEDFCSLDVLDEFTISYNKLKEFPNIFSSSEKEILMTSINVAHNEITSLPDDFKGVRVVTLTLSANPIKTFPKELAETDSYVEVLVMQSCGMEKFPEGCLDGKFTHNITTMDLQYNKLDDIPDDFNATSLPYLYGMDLTSNSFSKFPREPLNILRLTVFSIRGQRDAGGERCLREWPNGLYTHTGLRGFYIGSNDLRVIDDDTISYMIFHLDISDNPSIVFDASDICAYWKAGAFNLYYDKDQTILNCDAMLE